MRTPDAKLAPRDIRINAGRPRLINTTFAGKLGLSEEASKAYASAQVLLR